MASLTVVYWRDIPAQVIAEKGRGRKKTSFKVELSDRFAKAIDAAAMTSNLTTKDDYLAFWRRSDPEGCGEDLSKEARRMAAEIERSFSDIQLKQLIKDGGLDNGG